MDRWPTDTEYNSAVQNPALCFDDPIIRNAQPELTKLGIPQARSGAFATVYKMQTSSGDFAVRCFRKHFADQQTRYSEISRRLEAANLPFTVGFKFIEKGILVNGKWYPILRMEWVKGETLHVYVGKNLHNKATLLSLASQLSDMIQALQQQQIAHCDLQNGNILVADGRLILIDYDGMYVPALQGLESHELGQRNFQHPSRQANNFGPSLDNFSAWVIYVSLMALAADPGLWAAAGAEKSDEQLLFRREDFSSPATSTNFRLLSTHRDPSIRALGAFFQTIVCFSVDQIVGGAVKARKSGEVT